MHYRLYVIGEAESREEFIQVVEDVLEPELAKHDFKEK